MKKAAPWLVLLAALAGCVLLLRAQGRLWICSCGHILFWSGDINSADNSQHLFDPYTFTHIQHGFIFFGLVMLGAPGISAVWKFIAPMIIEAIWEVIENADFIIKRYRTETIAIGYTGDSIVNSLGDIVACAAGVLLAMRLGLKPTLVLFAAVEAGMILWFRDSLLLNVVMLLYPIEAIRAWQSAN